MGMVKNVIIFGLGFFIVLLLAATGAYLFVSDATLVPLISDYLESSTGTRITFSRDAVITRTLSPSFYVNNLIIEDEDKNFSAQVSALQLQINLPSLFSGKLDVPLLVLGDTRIEIKQSNSAGRLSLPDSLPLIPIFHNIQISELEIYREGKSVFLSTSYINDLAVVFDPDKDKFVALVTVGLAADMIHFNVELPRIKEILKNKRLPFVIKGKNSDLDLSIEGSIDFTSSSPRIQASARAQASSLKWITAGVKGFVVPGSLSAQATLAGTFEQLEMKEISATWHGPQQSVATVNGNIHNVIEMSGCEFKLGSHLEGGGWLAPVLPKSMGPLQSADISALLFCAGQQAKVRDFSLQAKTADQLNLSLSGQLNLVRHGQGGVVPEDIDLKLKFSAPTTRTARVLFFENVWEFGPIAGSANIRSAKDDPAIEDLSVLAKDPQGVEVHLAGRIAQFPLTSARPNTGYALAVVMKANETSTLMERLGVDLAVPGPVQVTYNIEGDSQALQLNKIKFSAGDKGGVHLLSTGNLLFGDWDLENPLANLKLNIQATSNDTPALERLLGQPLPDLGPLTAKALLHTVSGKQRIDGFQLQTSDKSPIQVSVKGSAEHSDFFNQPGIYGIELSAKVTAEDTDRLNTVFGLQENVPAIGPFKVSGDISGDHEKLRITNFAATAGKEDTLLIDIHGEPGIFSAANDWRPKGTNLSISAQATNSHTLFDLLEFHIPELGSVEAHAELKEKSNKLLLQSTSIVWGDADNPSLAVNGHIDDLIAFTGVDFVLKLNLDGHSFAALSDKVNLPDLKPLTGKIEISDSDGTLGIDIFHLESIDKQLLSIDSTGHFDDFNDPDTLTMTTQLRARDLFLIGALLDLQWPAVGPVQLRSKIQPEGEALAFDMTFTAGELKLQSEISGLFHTSPPQISGKITAQNFFLPFFLEGKPEAAESEDLRKDHVFSPDPISFNWLHKADLDLAVEIDSFDSERSQVQSSQLKIVVQSGVLKVAPAKLVYPKGELDFEIELDAKEHPRVRFEAYGENLNPWYAFDMKNSATNKEFDADLDIEIKVTSAGISEMELASNLQGTIYMNLRNGKIRRSLLDLLFLDFAGWTLNKVTADKYADVQCGVADYKINNGVIDTNGLFIDTKSISIVGEGTIDLANEKIDYVLLPKKKSKLIKRADPVNIKGPLNNPSVTAIPLKTAITTYGSLFFAPYLFVGIYAADLVTGMVPIAKNSSPCLEYERKHVQEEQAGEQ